MLKSPAQFALMLSLEDLFCCVDDFCQGCEGQWKQQMSGKWTPDTEPTSQLELEREHDDGELPAISRVTATSKPIIKRKCRANGQMRFRDSSAINASANGFQGL